MAAIASSLAAREHRLFAGNIDRSSLGFAERAIMIALRAPQGDCRDWDVISSWTGTIADALEAAHQRS